jgi:hypothetical protein
MDKEQRKALIADLRKYHEPTFKGLALTDAYFSAKHAHFPEDLPDTKCIGLFASEVAKGDSVYIEFVAMDYTPSDATRRLYVWNHQADYVTRYKQNKRTGQYLIPVTDLHVVSPIHDNRMGDKREDSDAYRTYKKTESIEINYFEKTFVSISGARVKMVWREEELFEYTYQPEKDKEPSTKLSGIELQDTYEFFKALKK